HGITPPGIEPNTARIRGGWIGAFIREYNRQMMGHRQGKLVADPIAVTKRLNGSDVRGARTKGCLSQKTRRGIRVRGIFSPHRRRWWRDERLGTIRRREM